MMNKRVRARITLADLLDPTLMAIQEDGGQVIQILPYNAGMTGATEDVGQGVGQHGFALDAMFVVTYFETVEIPDK